VSKRLTVCFHYVCEDSISHVGINESENDFMDKIYTDHGSPMFDN
jgi:hypothetical protein